MTPKKENYFVWLLRTIRCDHVSGEWFLYDFGRTKVRYCAKCGVWLCEKLLKSEIDAASRKEKEHGNG